MLDFSQFEVLTFDCYGTLIDWESGIFSALRPILAAHGKTISDSSLLELYGELEADAEHRDFQNYKAVLKSVVRGIGNGLGFTPSEREVCSLSDSLPNWRPFPDTVSALAALRSRFKLAIISNTDDDLISATVRHLQAEFDWVTTAEQARCYKPGLKIFEMALRKMSIPADRVLHVGQSIYHDVAPAKSLGLKTVWVNRPSPRSGSGATKPAVGTPDLEVHSLRELADLAVGTAYSTAG